MVSNEKACSVRISEHARDVLMRYSTLKGWSLAHFLDELTFTLTSGIDMIDDPSVPIETLKKFYPRCALVMYADVANIFSPNKEKVG